MKNFALRCARTKTKYGMAGSLLGVLLVLAGCGVAVVPRTTADTLYSCTNGLAFGSLQSPSGPVRCVTCDQGYRLDGPAGAVGTGCIESVYICENGEPLPDTPVRELDYGCMSCTNGFLVGTAGMPGSRCVIDVDDNNNGLIDIYVLADLDNIRYNLAGTSYDDEADDTGDNSGSTVGGPSAATTYCPTDTDGDGVFLCGYELRRNLNFDTDGNGNTWTKSTAGVFTLDNNDQYYNGGAGWDAIGEAGTMGQEFSAIFEGNGYTIDNMAIDTGSEAALGLFAAVDGGSVYNLKMTSALVRYSGSTEGAIGGIVGDLTGGVIINVSVDGTFTAADVTMSTARAGGIAGNMTNSTVAASSSTTAITGGSGNDFLGGLIGSVEGGVVVANYTTTAIDAGVGSDRVGGLVGLLQPFTVNSMVMPPQILANYSGGTVDGETGTDDFAGGLVGLARSGEITANYSTATVAAGSDTGDIGADLVGEAENRVTVSSSYGFGTATGTTAISSTKPTGVTTPSDLTSNNAGTCSVAMHITRSACDGATGTWTNWNSYPNSRNAWDFGNNVSAPVLRYADYDGASSGIDYCSRLRSTVSGVVCGANGTALPGQ